jgi:hypothetical protein
MAVRKSQCRQLQRRPRCRGPTGCLSVRSGKGEMAEKKQRALCDLMWDLGGRILEMESWEISTWI